MEYKLYEVGGRVRDKFLGLKSKDVDYSVVIEEGQPSINVMSVGEVFNTFVQQIKGEGFQVFIETPDCFTVRAKFPKDHKHAGLDADFVLARKEVGYTEGTRKPNVLLGSLQDDLDRRDFTVNAMAEDALGNIIDPFNGQQDLLNRVLRTPHDAAVSFNDDPLRILRGIRFSITKGLEFSEEVADAIKRFDADKMGVVSDDRIRVELEKMFRSHMSLSWRYLRWLEDTNPLLFRNIFREGMWFMPTNKN
jgi:poly(A) polymerase